MRRFTRFRSFCLLAAIALVTYAVFEAAVSALYVKGVLEPRSSIWLYEESGKTVHFDPVRGYRLSGDASRITRITRGVVEYVGVLKGNNQGFPDRDDFAPSAEEPSGRRFAVFGDSYTAAQFLTLNWPDRVEELARADGTSLRLLNFSTDGGGLANWWSVLTRLVEEQSYEIDGVVFAVIPGDLWRGFSVSDHRGYERPMFGRVPSWNPEDFPRTLDEARKYLSPFTMDAYIVPADAFDRALAMEWRPAYNRPLRPYFAAKVWRALRDRRPAEYRSAPGPRAFDSFDRWQAWMVEDMARSARALGVPVMVVHLPSREELLRGDFEAPPPVDATLFARMLDARLVDGKQAFSGRSAEEIRDLWLPYDAHWGQSGSDVFARYMADILGQWPDRESQPSPIAQ